MPSFTRSHSQKSICCAAALFFALAGSLALAGCQKSLRVEDPQLKPIQEMLDKELPLGSTETTVNQFLSVRGYPIADEHKPGTLVAIIRHIDTQKLQPVTARVTFYFDATDKLNNVEIVRTLNQPIPQ